MRNVTVDWVSTGSSSDIIDIARVVVDKTNGDYYGAGYFFHDITFQDVTAEGNDDYNTLLYKYNSTGTLQWFDVLRATLGSLAIDVTLGNSGVYIVGSYAGDMEADVEVLGVDIPSNVSISQGFIAKYSLDGELLYIRYIGNGGSYPVLVFTAKVDPTDDQLIIGVEYQHSVTLGNTTYEADSYDILIAKLTDDGEFIWVHAAEGDGIENIWDLDINEHGVMCAVGLFTDRFYHLQVPQDAQSSVWIMELDSRTGDMIWLNSVNITGDIQLAGLSISSTNSCRIAGDFSGVLQFNDHTEMSDLSDIFFINLNGSGEEVAFSNSVGVNSSVETRDLACSDNDFCYLAGKWSSDLIEFYLPNGTLAYQGIDLYSGFVLAIAPNGLPFSEVLSTYSNVHAVDIDADENVYASGMYEHPTSWGEYNVTLPELHYGCFALKITYEL
jgi:hypothetical protein